MNSARSRTWLNVEGLHRHEAVRVLKEARRFLRWATPLLARKEIVLLLLGTLVQIEMRRPREQAQGVQSNAEGLRVVAFALSNTWE